MQGILICQSAIVWLSPSTYLFLLLCTKSSQVTHMSLVWHEQHNGTVFDIYDLCVLWGAKHGSCFPEDLMQAPGTAMTRTSNQTHPSGSWTTSFFEVDWLSKSSHIFHLLTLAAIYLPATAESPFLSANDLAPLSAPSGSQTGGVTQASVLTDRLSFQQSQSAFEVRSDQHCRRRELPWRRLLLVVGGWLWEC